MTRKSLFIRSLGVAAALAAVTCCSLSARAEIVFGNLGASGTAALSDTNTDFGPDSTTTLALAQGFTTGSASLTLQSVTLGLFATSEQNGLPRSVSLFSSMGIEPGSLIGTSNTVQVGDKGTYTFDFSSINLSPNTGYWIVPQQGSRWYLNSAETQPTGLNGSGFTSLGTKMQEKSNPETWTTSNSPYSVSIITVPEPSTIVMAGFGAGGLAIMVQTRRRKAASHRR